LSEHAGAIQGANVKQTKKCPFCASKIEIEAVRCQFCGSDLKNSVSPTQEDAQPKKTLGRTVLYFMKIGAAVTLVLCLRHFLPEDVRQWLDWFLGEDALVFAPLRIIYVTLILFYIATAWTITWARKRSGLKVMDKEKQRNAD
jgi:hypothetical protein